MYTMRIISGGQTGADQAGLYAARDCGHETGGWAPKGFRTLGGDDHTLGTEFGLLEHKEYGYQFRTAENVKSSDATLRLAFNFSSRGEQCTKKAITKHNKRWLDVDLANPINPHVVAKWMAQFECVNIAGNGDGKVNGEVFNKVYEYLTKVFKEMQEL
jgi:hypothetical protein